MFSAELPEGHASWTLRLTDSDDGTSGDWTYLLESLPKDRCRLTLTEQSHSEKFLLRGLQTLAGRDAGLRRELESLKRAAETAKK